MSRKTGIIIQIIAIVIFVCCASYLGKYFYDGYKADNEFDSLAAVVERTEKENGEEARAENGMLAGYYELHQKNGDMVGWIRIPDTEVNYPVVQSADNNEFYLRKNFEKEYQSGGIPFADYQCDVDKPSDNVIIYAHNMKNGSMFAALLDYENRDFLKEHKIIEFDTLYQRGRYEVLYAFHTNVGRDGELKYHEFINAGKAEDFYEFIDDVKSQTIFMNGSAQYGDKLLTLSTCSYNVSNERFVVIAKKIK